MAIFWYLVKVDFWDYFQIIKRFIETCFNWFFVSLKMIAKVIFQNFKKWSSLLRLFVIRYYLLGFNLWLKAVNIVTLRFYFLKNNRLVDLLVKKTRAPLLGLSLCVSFHSHSPFFARYYTYNISPRILYSGRFWESKLKDLKVGRNVELILLRTMIGILFIFTVLTRMPVILSVCVCSNRHGG